MYVCVYTAFALSSPAPSSLMFICCVLACTLAPLPPLCCPSCPSRPHVLSCLSSIQPIGDERSASFATVRRWRVNSTQTRSRPRLSLQSAWPSSLGAPPRGKIYFNLIQSLLQRRGWLADGWEAWWLSVWQNPGRCRCRCRCYYCVVGCRRFFLWFLAGLYFSLHVHGPSVRQMRSV